MFFPLRKHALIGTRPITTVLACIVLSLFVAACAAGEDALVTIEPETAAAPTAATATPTVEPVAPTEVAVQPTPVPAPPTGRVALAAAEAEPHVLWFWGAH